MFIFPSIAVVCVCVFVTDVRRLRLFPRLSDSCMTTVNLVEYIINLCKHESVCYLCHPSKNAYAMSSGARPGNSHADDIRLRSAPSL